jgi:hypothetical protein
VVPGFPDEVAAAVARAMARNRDDRPANAAELRDALAHAYGALGMAA